MAKIVTADKKADIVTITPKQLELLALVRQKSAKVVVVKSLVTATTGRDKVSTFSKATATALVELGLANFETTVDRKNVETVSVKPVEGVLLAS